MGGEEREEKRRGEGWRVAFWNMAGLENKDKEFWRRWRIGIWWCSRRYGLTRRAGRMKDRIKCLRILSRGAQEAKKRNKKSRAMGRMAIGIRRELLEKGTRIVGEKKGVIVRRVRIGKKSWRVIGV